MMLWAAFGDQWALEHKVTFDGENKTITVGPDVSNLDIRLDVYSSWKEWVSIYDNSKFLPAIRTTGGDPIGGGLFTGDVYFLVNGWKLLLDLTKVAVTGVLYSDDYNTAYYALDETPQFPIKVSSVVNTVSVGGSGGSSLTAADIWSYNSRTITQPIPSAVQIADAVRNELAPELAQITSFQPGLTTNQETMLLEIYRMYGLDPTQPLIVTKTSREVGDSITQVIITDNNQTTVARV